MREAKTARIATTDYIREQLVPADNALHAACDRCWCNPQIKDGILVHNATTPNHETQNTKSTSQPASAHTILTKAAQIVQGDRAAQHGPKERNHQNIADHWNAYLKNNLKTPLTAHDVALMMIELKIARAKGSIEMNLPANPDNYVDMAGYAGVAGEIALNEGKEAQSCPLTKP